MYLTFSIGLTVVVGGIGLICLLCFIMFLMETIDLGYTSGTVGTGLLTIAAIVGIIFIWVGHNSWLQEYNSSYNNLVTKIVSLDREAGADGSFFLGCGVVEEKPIYYYYYEVSPNVYTLGSVKSDKNHAVYIVETSDYEPSIYKYKDAKIDPSKYNYNIYVPFGTVIKTFVA